MNITNLFLFSRGMRAQAVIAAMLLATVVLTAGAAAEQAPDPSKKPHRPFHPGEKLTYVISWSKVFSAGTAVLEVRKERSEDGKDVYRFISTARTTGMVDKAYTVRDVVQSVVEKATFRSISYDLTSSHGKKKKARKILFDHKEKKVTSVVDGAESVVDIPENTLDALSSVYSIRMTPEFVVGKPVIVGIHDSGKNWSVEIHVLGKERIKTPAGEFNTIKVKTYPKYDGVFMHKGEIFIWLSDDDRRIPVLMKSTITIGSIVAQLTEMKLGDEAQ